MELITLKTFSNPIDAHMLKSMLESDGISCYVMDEHMVTLNPLYNVTVGGIRLQIHDADLPRALEIMQETEKLPYTNETDETVKCPSCGSTDLYAGFNSMKNPAGILTWLFAFLLFVLPFYTNTLYRCKKCNTEFKAKV